MQLVTMEGEVPRLQPCYKPAMTDNTLPGAIKIMPLPGMCAQKTKMAL